jgi:hypothetical protein
MTAIFGFHEVDNIRKVRIHIQAVLLTAFAQGFQVVNLRHCVAMRFQICLECEFQRMGVKKVKWRRYLLSSGKEPSRCKMILPRRFQERTSGMNWEFGWFSHGGKRCCGPTTARFSASFRTNNTSYFKSIGLACNVTFDTEGFGGRPPRSSRRNLGLPDTPSPLRVSLPRLLRCQTHLS